METNLEDFDSELLLKQLRKTESMIEELETKAREYDYVPRVPLSHTLHLIRGMKTKLQEVRSRDDISLMEKIDDLLNNI